MEKITIPFRRPTTPVAATEIPDVFTKAFKSSAADLLNPTSQKPVQARAFEVTTSASNYTQYGNTIRAYIDAGMTFEDIAKAATHLGDTVRVGTANTSIQTEMYVNSGRVTEEAGRITAVQNRGESITITAGIIPSVSTSAGVLTNSQTSALNYTEQQVPIVEGISVQNGADQNGADLQRNPFLSAPAKL